VSNAPFSSIALLAQSGQLPTVPVKKAVSNAIGKLMLDVLRRFREHPPEGFEAVAGFKPSDIPEDLELACMLEVKLPQDVFRNAQVASMLVEKGVVDSSWARENVLQISNPDEIQEKIWEQKSADAFYKLLLENFMREAITKMTAAPGGPGGAPPGAAPGGMPEGMPEERPQMMPAGEMSGEGVQIGGPAAAAAGGGRVEATAPIAPRGTRRPRPGGGNYGQ
jgi:hypothetical protein